MKLNKPFQSAAFQLAVLLGLTAGISSCEQAAPQPSELAAVESASSQQNKTKTFYGPAVEVGEGVAKAWITVNAQGNPVSVGVNVSETAIQTLGQDPAVFVLSLPRQVTSTLYDHITFNWNPQGHPLEGIYTLPHMDLHFNMISVAEREAITGLPMYDENGAPVFDIAPAAAFMPVDYELEPGKVPGMGAHLLDMTAPEHHGHTFTKTFIFGTDKGDFIFHEPMFTNEYLNSLKQNANAVETIAIKQPASFQVPGFYPTNYTFSYQTSPKEYSITLGGFVYQQ